MNLVFDLGNTQFKVGIFEENSLLSSYSISYDNIEELIAITSSMKIDRIALSSVKNIPNDLQEILNGYAKEVYYFNNNSIFPIDIEYKTPQTLGHDRICNVIAAHSLYPDKDILVIDLGTCNKYDFITKEGKYIGGAISPGFKMRFDSMNHYTDQLPLLDPVISEQFIGDSTNNSMISGAYFGVIGEIKYFTKQYGSQFRDIEVLLTGGFARHFEKALKNHIFAHPYLTLIGLNIILNFQEEK